VGDLRFEPQGALTDGSVDGLRSLGALIAGAPMHLAAGGWLWLEHGFDQAPACRALLVAAGFAEIRSVRDLAGLERVSGGCWAAGRG
jgi:release factor glutamine methyltransferase